MKYEKGDNQEFLDEPHTTDEEEDNRIELKDVELIKKASDYSTKR